MNQEHIFFEIVGNSQDPKTGLIESMAAIRTDNEGNELARWYDPTVADSDFATVIEGLKSTIITKRTDRFVVVSHFGEYSRNYLLNNCKIARVLDPFEGRMWIDSAQLAWPLVVNDIIKERSVAELAKFYGVNYSPRSSDVIGRLSTLVETYWCMMDRYRVGLKAEGMIRTSGAGLLSRALQAISR